MNNIVETIKNLSEDRKKHYKSFYNDQLRQSGYKSIKHMPKSSRRKFYADLDTGWKAVEEELNKQELQETNSSGGVEGYLTPNAFTGEKPNAEKRIKHIATQLGYKIVGEGEVEERDVYRESMFMENKNINESLDVNLGANPTLTPKQQFGHAVREIRNNLTEVEKLVNRTLKLKNESGIQSEQYGKRAYKALSKINEKINKLMVSLQNFK